MVKIKFITLAALAVVSTNVFAEVTVSDVQVFSGYPWKEVAIGYTIFGKAEDNQWLRVTAKDLATGKTYDCVALDGAKVRPLKLERQRLSEGRHVTMWNASADEAKFKSGNVVFTVEITDDPPLYCAIDLSGGLKAERYEVEEIVGVQHIGWPDEYKTTKLPLRRIEAGSVGNIAITVPFFIGVFEVTQKQYGLVTGGDASYFHGDMFPVDNASYDEICSGFLDKLRTKTGVAFGIPTVAQWEYACRAGTTTAYSYGKKADGAYMWYASNSNGSVHDVGTRLPNGWGLYDMHGNAWEWSSDEAKAPAYGLFLCGGDRRNDDCSSSCRDWDFPEYRGYKYLSSIGSYYYSGSYGFRLVMPVLR